MVGCLFGFSHHAKNVLIHRKIAVECVQVIKDKGKTLFPEESFAQFILGLVWPRLKSTGSVNFV